MILINPLFRYIFFYKKVFLYNTGFKCYILKDILELGKGYDVIIRLRNQFDSSDIIDILSQRKL